MDLDNIELGENGTGILDSLDEFSKNSKRKSSKELYKEKYEAIERRIEDLKYKKKLEELKEKEIEFEPDVLRKTELRVRRFLKI